MRSSDLRRVLLSMAIALGHNLTGANAMLYYSSYILTELNGGSTTTAGVSHLTKEIGVAVAKVAGVCTALAVVDRVGRRPLLLVGSVLMLTSYAVFSACFWALESSPSSSFQTLGLWNLYAFIFAWNLSWAPLMWVVCVELLGDEFRSVGMGLTFAVFWLGSALSNQTLLSLFHTIGTSVSPKYPKVDIDNHSRSDVSSPPGTSGTFLLYAVLTSCSLVFVVLKVSEQLAVVRRQLLVHDDCVCMCVFVGSRDRRAHVRADRAAPGAALGAAPPAPGLIPSEPHSEELT